MCGCEQGTCLGNCPCGCSHYPAAHSPTGTVPDAAGPSMARVEAAVDSLRGDLFCADHVGSGAFEDDGEVCAGCERVLTRIAVAALAAADAVGADDTAGLVAEVERLRRWKAEALPVMDGLQELGEALDLPLGTRITGAEAVAAVKALVADEISPEDAAEAAAQEFRLHMWDESERNWHLNLRCSCGEIPGLQAEAAGRWMLRHRFEVARVHLTAGKDEAIMFARSQRDAAIVERDVALAAVLALADEYATSSNAALVADQLEVAGTLHGAASRLRALVTTDDRATIERVKGEAAARAEERGQGICRTCCLPIWNEGGTLGHREVEEGWSDRVERGGDSVVCFKAIGYRHVPLEGREAAIYDKGLDAARAATYRTTAPTEEKK